jgi:hypothetical protein
MLPDPVLAVKMENVLCFDSNRLSVQSRVIVWMLRINPISYRLADVVNLYAADNPVTAAIRIAPCVPLDRNPIRLNKL